MLIRVAALVLALLITGVARADLADTVRLVRPAIVGIGTFEATRRPPADLRGTGFMVGDGLHVVTSLHVVDNILNEAAHERLVVFVGSGEEVELRDAEVVASDPAHDAAVLRIDGEARPIVRLAGDGEAQSGDDIAFTGFPIGGALGLYPATHRGIVAAWTPILIPVVDPKKLTTAMIKQLKENDFYVYQLDATAYPGNSGSPLYRPEDGVVIAIVSSVFVKGSKETAITDPSGITYAIPIRYARDLLIGLGQTP